MNSFIQAPSLIKSAEDIEKMRVAGKLAAEVLGMIAPYVKAGITTAELDQICHDYIVNVQGAIPAPLNYRGFPKSICTSVNHVVCHGIPSDSKVLKNGDMMNIDITVIKDGFHGDTSEMFFIGEPSILAKRLSDVAQEAMIRLWRNAWTEFVPFLDLRPGDPQGRVLHERDREPQCPVPKGLG